MKTIGISALAIVFIFGAWGYYYYAEMYVPVASARAMASLYHALPQIIAGLHVYNQADEMDFDSAKSILNEQCGRIQSMRQGLVSIPYARQTETTRRYFEETLGVLEKACSEALNRIERIGALMNLVISGKRNQNRCLGII